MKLILDFDDVLFKNTPEFKDWMFSVIAEAGVARTEEEAAYAKERAKGFSLKRFLIDRLGNDNQYKKILSKCPELINKDIEALARNAGKNDCYLISHGDKEYQTDKIVASGAAPLFKEIIIVLGSKKGTVENICAENPEEEVIFYDDKEDFLSDLDRQKYPNLKTVLYKRG